MSIDHDNACWSPAGSLDWSAAELVRRLRLMRGWTQRELAARAGVAQSHVVKVEAGGDVRLTDRVLSAVRSIADKSLLSEAAANGARPSAPLP